VREADDAAPASTGLGVGIALVLLAVIDWSIAAVLVGVSGFVFGSGPESVHAGLLFGLVFFGFVLFAAAAPIAAFLMRARRPGLAIALAAAPLLVVIAFSLASPALVD
jgi:hypothetical protein